MKVCRHCSEFYMGSPRRCWMCGARLSEASDGTYIFWGLVGILILAMILAHLPS